MGGPAPNTPRVFGRSVTATVRATRRDRPVSGLPSVCRVYFELGNRIEESWSEDRARSQECDSYMGVDFDTRCIGMNVPTDELKRAKQQFFLVISVWKHRI